jgi:hypothetical protein
LSNIPRPLFPNFQRAPLATTQQLITHRKPTHEKYISEYRREYATLGPNFH